MRLVQSQVVAPNVTVKVGPLAAFAAPAEALTSAAASEAAPSLQSAPSFESVAQYEHKVRSLLGLCYVSALRESLDRLQILMHELSLLQIRNCLRVASSQVHPRLHVLAHPPTAPSRTLLQACCYCHFSQSATPALNMHGAQHLLR